MGNQHIAGAITDRVEGGAYAVDMPRRSKGYRTPREWLPEGEWPEGAIVEEAPTAVRYAVEIARRLEDELRGRSKAEVARRADLERSTLYDLLSGQTWPDTITLAKLEEVLQVRLWPEHPLPPTR